MVHGLARPRLRLVAPAGVSAPFPIRTTALRPPRLDAWADERGATLFAAGCDVIGGFPGYADHGALLDDVTLRITTAYLLAEEGHPRGFALPIRAIDGTALVDDPERGEVGLRVFFRDGDSPRVFTLRFRANRFGHRHRHRLRGGRGHRSVRAQATLHAAGVDDRFAEGRPPEPAFTLPWDRTGEFEREAVIWTGRASAPIRPGTESAPSDVWLTTRSLIWGSGRGNGINRVPLTLLADLVTTRLRDRLGTPVVYVGLAEQATGRSELPFVFDLGPLPAHNFRERDDFLGGLRAQGIADGSATPTCQPWRRLPPSMSFATDDLAEHPRAAAPHVDVVLAEWSGLSSPSAPDDIPLASAWAAEDDPRPAPASATPAAAVAAAVAVADRPAASPGSAIDRYEMDALAAIGDALRAIDGRLAGHEAQPPTAAPPTSRDQSRALAALAESGDDAGEAARRSERLLALGELSARLQTWLELHAAGHLSAAQLGRKRDALTPTLTELLPRDAA